MGKKIIRLTESDLTNIVKRVIEEQGGYDDPDIMTQHYTDISNSMIAMVRDIVKMVNDTKEAMHVDIPREQLMAGIVLITGVLDKIEDALVKITPEILLNNDLKREVKNLSKEVRKGKSKIRLLADASKPHTYSKMKRGLTGIGYSMNKKDLNDKLFNILIDIGKAAEKLYFQMMDENENMIKRMERFGGLN